MIQKFNKIEHVKGKLSLPGDKSISHRSIMFSCLAKGTSVITNCLDSEDINSTIECFTALGCNVKKDNKRIIIEGKGLGGFTKPAIVLNAGNSGTTARLISGVLAMQKFETVLVGDESLTKRPMGRVIDPLTQMGAVIKVSDKKTLPVTFSPSAKIHPIEFELNVPSAQVKSAVLLAGLHLDEKTIVYEKDITRDHTERMLGLSVEEVNGKRKIGVSKDNYPAAQKYSVPSDISTAAFFIVLTLLSKNSELLLQSVSLNKTRTGILTVLKKMGADIEVSNTKTISGEELGDLIIRSSKLTNVNIEEELVSNIIDEVPILSVAGLLSEGNFVIRNAKELRVKESDRITSMCNNFRKLGVDVKECEDGFELSGKPTISNVIFESYKDHRIAMAFSVFSLLTGMGEGVNEFECVSISNPNFLHQIKQITV